MAGRVRVPDDDGEGGARVLNASVGAVSPQPVPATGWLARPGIPASARGHLVRLDFESTAALETLRGKHCRLDVVTDRHPPVLLLLSAGGRR